MMGFEDDQVYITIKPAFGCDEIDVGVILAVTGVDNPDVAWPTGTVEKGWYHDSFDAAIEAWNDLDAGQRLTERIKWIPLERFAEIWRNIKSYGICIPAEAN